MIQLVFYKERDGDDHPSLKDISTGNPIKDKTKVLQYLKKSPVIAAAPGFVTDRITGDRVTGELLAYCDGKYHWNSEDIYYFETYNITLPDDFIARATSRLSVPEKEVHRLAREYLDQISKADID